MRSELEPWNVKCETITTVEQMRSACRLSACTPLNRRCQRRHWCRALWSACWCTRRSSFTCDDVVLIHFVLVALLVASVFIVAILRRILLYWRYSVYTPVGDSKLLLAVTEF